MNMQIASLARALFLTTIANRADWDGTADLRILIHASMHRAASLLAALATLFRSVSKCPMDLGGPMPEMDPIQATISVGFG